MNEDDQYTPRGIPKEHWASMLAEVEKRAAANQKRLEAMKAGAAAKKAARLAMPPADLHEAWRRHVDSCPYLPPGEARTAWFRENYKFDFDGTKWRREMVFQKTNSGKGQRLRSITYFGDDGRVERYEERPNRRNDEARNWGLPE